MPRLSWSSSSPFPVGEKIDAMDRDSSKSTTTRRKNNTEIDDGQTKDTRLAPLDSGLWGKEEKKS